MYIEDICKKMKPGQNIRLSHQFIANLENLQIVELMNMLIRHLFWGSLLEEQIILRKFVQIMMRLFFTEIIEIIEVSTNTYEKGGINEY